MVHLVAVRMVSVTPESLALKLIKPDLSATDLADELRLLDLVQQVSLMPDGRIEVRFLDKPSNDYLSVKQVAECIMRFFGLPREQISFDKVSETTRQE